MDADDRDRAEREKQIATPLETAYAKDGRAALEGMKGVEPLFLMNWKVKAHNALSRLLKDQPGNKSLRQQRDRLLAEIRDINAWVKEKLQVPGKQPGPSHQPSKRRNIDMDMG